MTALSNGHARPVEIPNRPSGDPNAQASAHAHAHEETPVTARELPARAARVVPAVFAGVSLVGAQPPSLAALWEHHAACAAHYQSGFLRWPRYAWGAVHTAVAAVLRAAEWVTDSPPKLLVAAAVAAACWFWS